MKIGFDLDGTIYDTLGAIFELDQQTRRELGYGPISRREYRRIFQTEDWSRLCMDLGIREDDLEEYRYRLEKKIEALEPPRLVPGGKEAVDRIVEEVGWDNFYIITNNRNPEEIKRRFDRDGLSHLFERVSHPYEGKADVLFEIARADPDSELIYVGDLVSDGRACELARGMGAENIKFCAIIHRYSMNLPEDLREFVEGRDFAFSIESINDIHGLA